MNPVPPLSERVRRAFEPTESGVIGLVEALLDSCPEPGLHLHWEEGRCHVRSLETPSQDSTEISLPKSVFRAVLARIAALCNERIPDSVSPYGGEGEVSGGTQPPTGFRVTFTNTPGEQSLELRHREKHENGSAAGEALDVSGDRPGVGTRPDRIVTR